MATSGFRGFIDRLFRRSGREPEGTTMPAGDRPGHAPGARREAQPMTDTELELREGLSDPAGHPRT